MCISHNESDTDVKGSSTSLFFIRELIQHVEKLVASFVRCAVFITGTEGVKELVTGNSTCAITSSLL